MPANRLYAYATLLEDFIVRYRLKPAAVARAASCSRQHLGRLRRGEAEPTRDMMIRIAEACGNLRGRRVTIDDVFELRFVGSVAEVLESINPS